MQNYGSATGATDLEICMQGYCDEARDGGYIMTPLYAVTIGQKWLWLLNNFRPLKEKPNNQVTNKLQAAPARLFSQ